MKWPDERIEAMGELIDLGLSATRIGSRMGVSKNAILGKAHRLGWSVGRPREPHQRVAPYQEVKPRRQRKPRRTYTERILDRGFRQISTQFDQSTICDVEAFAQRMGWPRAEAIRTLVEWGLESAGVGQ
jgi:hypothetical protein